MLYKKKVHPTEKSELHLRNRHKKRYDFKELIDSCPELASFVYLNAYNDESIDFFNPDAVKMLNKALLKYYYDIDYWEIPQNYLCPPIPGRADYIHYIADLLGKHNNRKIPKGNHVKCLDIGVGANCVYPIIGNKEYGWLFKGSDIDTVAINSANNIIEKNPFLKEKVEVILQPNKQDFFRGIISNDEYFDITICNPPFHASPEEAKAGTLRKLSNLNRKRITQAKLNFGGQNTELWCEGGEAKFVSNMIHQSRQFSLKCLWFSSLISKEASMNVVYDALRKTEATEIELIPMGQGNKKSRIIAWTFQTKDEHLKRMNEKW
ncbi:MAG: 23S rRNA (adenine(1618)-N(6))-methyltransferase RlmF [Bacteroidetes bacterium]|nr:23S rRNA (adenine(1618)-N(6))-methyltransferase RlmF [Bacteroidota bacterium]